MKFQSNAIFNGTITANSVSDAGTNTDKFLVLSSSGLVSYRTAAELYADLEIGALPAGYTSTLKHQVKAGVALTKGQAVYVTTADGTNMIVGKASNSAESTSSKTLGLIETSLSLNGIGNVITEGLLAGLDTTGANAAGDPVWLGTNGDLIYGLTNKPSAPSHLVFIGVVTRINANNGEIFVKVQNGFELEELHNVDLKTTTPINGHILGYNGTLWVNKTIAGWLGYTPADDSLVLHKAGAETITGNKSFDASPYFNTAIGLKAPSGIYQYISALNNGIAMTIGSASQSLLFSTSTNYTYTFPNSDGTIALLSNIPTLSGLGGVPTSRTLTINGVSYDLSADRSWSVTSMVYPAAGIAVSTGTAWGTSITNNSSNWNTAYGWGNHASAGYVPGARTITINGTSYDLTADRSWTISTSASARNVQKFTSTASQTTFTISGGYTPGLVDVFVNGVKLDNATDFTATNGTTVVLTDALIAGQTVEVYNYITAFTANNSLRQITSFTATAGQTSFTVTYSPGFVDVFYNGSRLAASEYTATSGSAIVLLTACIVNDIVEVIAYNYAVGAFTGIGGSGTTNYISKFTASGTINNSILYDNGTNLGIGTEYPSYKLDVNGTGRFTGLIYANAGIKAQYGRIDGRLFSTSDAEFGDMTSTTGCLSMSFDSTGQQGYLTSRNYATSTDKPLNYNGSSHIFNGGKVSVSALDGESLKLQLATSTGNNYLRFYSSGGSGLGYIGSFYSGGTQLMLVDGSGTDLSLNGNANLLLRTGGTERIRITSTGNVGIGTTSPLQTTANRTVLTVNGTNQSIVNLGYSGTLGGYFYADSVGAEIYSAKDLLVTSSGAYSTLFYTNGSERMRINNIGAVMVGTSSAPNYKGIHVGGTASSICSIFSNYSSSAVGFEMTDSANSLKVQFFGSSGNYYFAGSNISDRRAKSNIQEINNGLSILTQLKPSTFTYDKNPNIIKGGFIAQEVLEVIPEFVTIPEDESEMMGVDYFGILALAVQSIKELKAEIEQLKAK